MTLIKCPSCDHTISSVASKCPRCGYLLTQPRFQQGNKGTLSECRRCGGKVLSKARVCPYCGLTKPARRSRMLALLVVGGLAASIALLSLQDRLAPGGLPIADTVTAADPITDLGVATAAPRPAPAPPAARGTPASVPDSPAVAVASRDSLPVGAAGDSVAARDTMADPAAAVAVPAVPLQTRWAADWANIREGRSLDAPVVGLVRRGEMVQVANQAEGWWEVYRGGRFLGYVAADLLLTEPPAIP